MPEASQIELAAVIGRRLSEFSGGVESPKCQRLIAAFTRSVISHLASARCAYAIRDTAAFHHALHTLMGAVLNIGAHDLGEELARVGKSGLPADANEAAAVLRQLEATCAEVLAAVSHLTIIPLR